jgi:hypothetical protein
MGSDKLTKEDIWKMLDFLYKLDEEAVKEWIYQRWPHGFGLFE